MVHDYPPMTGGGLALAALDLALIAGESADVVVLTSRLVDHFADDRAAGPAVEGVAVRQVTALQAARSLVPEDRIIVHWTFSYRRLSTLALIFGPRLAQSVVCVVHTAPGHMRFNRIRLLPDTLRWLLMRLTALQLARCQAVIALGPTHARLLAEVGIHPTHVAPLPVSDEMEFRSVRRAAAQDQGGQVRIGVAGELSRLKGIDDLPLVLRALTPCYAFRIVGQGPLRWLVNDAVGALRPVQRACVVVDDRVDPTEMHAFFASVDCLLLLSRSESQCRIALESMLAGVIVLARPADGLVDVVQDAVTGFHVDPGRPEEVDRLLRRLAADPVLVEAVREKAREFASHLCQQSRETWRGLTAAIAGGSVAAVGEPAPDRDVRPDDEGPRVGSYDRRLPPLDRLRLQSLRPHRRPEHLEHRPVPPPAQGPTQ